MCYGDMGEAGQDESKGKLPGDKDSHQRLHLQPAGILGFA